MSNIETEPTPDDFITGQLERYVAEYFDTLQNGKRAEFKTLSFDEKIEKTCWGLGSNEATYQDSIYARGLTIVRGMLDYIETDQTGQERPYYLPTGVDPMYWGNVDSYVHKLIASYAKERDYHVTEAGFDAGSFGLEPYLLARIGQHGVYKQHNLNTETQKVVGTTYIVAQAL